MRRDTAGSNHDSDARNTTGSGPRSPVARDDEARDVDAAVGRRIRELRKRHGLSLEAVAGSTGLSIGFLSQIERGLSSPTLRALTSLADAMGVSIADLLQQQAKTRLATPAITRSRERSSLVMWKSGITKALLAGGNAAAGAQFSFSVLDFDLAATSGAELYKHRGEEAGYVVKGRLRLSVGAEGHWLLDPGDSFHFRSDQLHRFENAARTHTVVVMVNLNAPAD